MWRNTLIYRQYVALNDNLKRQSVVVLPGVPHANVEVALAVAHSSHAHSYASLLAYRLKQIYFEAAHRKRSVDLID